MGIQKTDTIRVITGELNGTVGKVIEVAIVLTPQNEWLAHYGIWMESFKQLVFFQSSMLEVIKSEPEVKYFR